MKITDFITVIGILATLIISFLNRRLLKIQMIQQRKIENNKISANIMSKSRIEWIQSVRKITAETLSAFTHLYIIEFECAHKYRKSDYKKELEVASNEFISKINELILYFAVSKSNMSFNDLNIQGEMLSIPSPSNGDYFSQKERSDQRKKIEDDYKNTQAMTEANKVILKPLYNSKTNKDKNELIVTLLEDLITSSEIEFFEYQKDSEDNKINNVHIKYNYSEVYNSRTDTLKHYMDELRNIIALYLKIEWDRAKIGR